MRYISFKESVLVQEASLGLCQESSSIFVIKYDVNDNQMCTMAILQC